jgi:hypothetical protein
MQAGVERLLKDKGSRPRAGKKRIADDVRLQVVTKDATHWTVRMMTQEMSVGHTTVQRIWKAHGLSALEAADIQSSPPITCNVYLDGHALHGGSVQRLDGGFSFRLDRHLYKTEAPRLAGKPVGN